MASIILSFVGSQDPYSEKTNEEGSISTLIRHLLSQQYQIRRVILLYTQDLAEKAQDTKDWLHSELELNSDIIDTIVVSEELSNDPVNFYLAVQEARKGLEQAQPFLSKKDRLEFNASSGTPVMKTAWGILQAAGYAPQSSIWQVRNPHEKKEGQSRVFQTNVDTVKNEFDLKVLERQIQDYNYSGALVTLETSNLSTPLIQGLLQYGHYRLGFNFDQAFNAIQSLANYVDRQFSGDVSQLRQKNQLAFLQEVYFKSVIELENQQYADFLTDVFKFQEGFLKYLLQTKLANYSIKWPSNYNETEYFWQQIQQIDGGQLCQYFKNTNSRSLPFKGFPSRYNMIDLLEYYQESSSLMTPLKELNIFCENRNQSMHNFAGVSKEAVEDAPIILKNMRQILQQKIALPKDNIFNVLNQTICDLLREGLSK
jgi:hypothetical protein